MMKEIHKGDPCVDIVPIAYPEQEAQAMEGSHIARNMSGMRRNDLPALMKVRNFTPYDLDCLVWDYVLFSGKKHDKIVLAEWDMRCTQNVRDFYGEVLNRPIVGSKVRKSPHFGRWPWVRPGFISEDFLSRVGNYASSVSPTCGIVMDWDLAEKNALTMMQNPRLFDNMHNELAIGTLSSINGSAPEHSGKIGFIDYNRVVVREEDVGIFHPVKTVCVATKLFRLLEKKDGGSHFSPF
jgi:hypothetical protein